MLQMEVIDEAAREEETAGVLRERNEVLAPHGADESPKRKIDASKLKIKGLKGMDFQKSDLSLSVVKCAVNVQSNTLNYDVTVVYGTFFTDELRVRWVLEHVAQSRFEEYKSISEMLVCHIRRLEEEQAENAEYEGVRHSQLVQWLVLNIITLLLCRRK
ncbi:unnamed protein product [Toxocara canis]|uniref:MCM6_C domain-containing protein n=1 Tax=Toxocara canis TaxID=6265 RepID=A0A183U8F5_TOXCA|nr:unnamed protein product [Toxocara canis]